MTPPLSIYNRVFGLRRFPPGRMLTVLRAIRQMASDADLPALVERTDIARADAITYIGLRTRRRSQRVARGDGEARRIDKIIDDDIGEIARVARREAERFPDSPSGRAARRLVDAFFAQGVNAITQIPYDEELAVVEVMMPAMRRDHADAIEHLGLERCVRRIEEHLPLYRDALAPEDKVTAAGLSAAYARMQSTFVRAVGWIVCIVDDPELVQRLMAPVMAHDDQMAALRAARRRGAATGGEDLPAAELDLDAEARAALEAAERSDRQGEGESEAEGGEP